MRSEGALIDLEAYRNRRRAQRQRDAADSATAPMAAPIGWAVAAPMWIVWFPVWRFA